GPAHRRRARIPRLQHRHLVWHAGSRRHAARDRRQAKRRGQRHFEKARSANVPRHEFPDAGGRHARAVRRKNPHRHRTLRSRHQEGRHPHRMISSTVIASRKTMSKLRLSLGCWDYDRTRALMDGTVVPDGIDLNYLNMPVEETFFRMLRHREFDVAEMSLSSYTVSLFKPEKPFIAIPVFPSRFFRHSCIYVNAD